MKRKSISKQIEQYAGMFTTKERNGEQIVIFADNVTQALKDSVMKAHGDRMPDDWMFGIYSSLLDKLNDYEIKTIDDINDNGPEIIDSLVDVYTHDQTAWLNSSIDNVNYLSEAMDEYEPEDGFKLLSVAQYIAISQILDEVISLLSK